MHRRSARTWMLIISLLWTLPAAAAFPGSDLFLPSVARSAGASDSQWYTTVWLHNPGSESAAVTVALLLRGQSNTTPDTQAVIVDGGQTLSFGDVLYELFGLEEAVGALRFTTSGKIVVGARVYNLADGSIAESQGQFMAGLPASFAIGGGQMTHVPGITQPEDSSFRSNFGLVETTGADVQVKITAFDGAGVELGATILDLSPYEPVQYPLSRIATGLALDGGRLQMEVVSGSGKVLAFASMVGNGSTSQDPSTLEMEVATLGDITGVTAGPGLAGGGSEGDVSLQVAPGNGLTISNDLVAIADGGVSRTMLAHDAAVTSLTVDSQSLSGDVELRAGNNISLTSGTSFFEVANACIFATHVEKELENSLYSTNAGTWYVSPEYLEIPFSGRWRLGYSVIQEVENYGGLSTINDPVNVALVNVDTVEIISHSVNLTQVPVDLSFEKNQVLTISKEVVVDLEVGSNPLRIGIGVRSSRSDLRITLHPFGYELGVGLTPPAGRSYLWADCYGTVEP